MRATQSLSPHDAKFESYEGMPAKGTKLSIWRNNQLTMGCNGLEAKIIAEAEFGGTEWKRRKDMLVRCSDIKKASRLPAHLSS